MSMSTLRSAKAFFQQPGAFVHQRIDAALHNLLLARLVLRRSLPLPHTDAGHGHHLAIRRSLAIGIVNKEALSCFLSVVPLFAQ